MATINARPTTPMAIPALAPVDSPLLAFCRMGLLVLFVEVAPAAVPVAVDAVRSVV
jgi:hypothetical protein